MDTHKWIRAEEQKPNALEWVLCYLPGHRDPHYDVLCWKNGYWEDVFRHCLERDAVTHWMPLPEAPEVAI